MKRAVIMGATSGIGKDVATLLANQGWQVAVAGRRETLLVQLESEHENIVCHKQIDVNQNDAPQLLEELIASLGGMDLYFHSSGIGWQNTELDEEKELKTVTTNCLGFTRMVDAAFNWYAKRPNDGHKSGHCLHNLNCRNKRVGCRSRLFGNQAFPKQLSGSPCATFKHTPLTYQDIGDSPRICGNRPDSQRRLPHANEVDVCGGKDCLSHKPQQNRCHNRLEIFRSRSTLAAHTTMFVDEA